MKKLVKKLLKNVKRIEIKMPVISSIQNFAQKNAVPIMQDESNTFICDYIREHNCKKVLEIGTAIGFSSIKFALVSEDVFVTTIESDINRHIKAKENIHNFGLDQRINAIYADALQYELNDNFDLIFIDAAKAQYIKFFEKYKNNLSKNGVIITDNLSFHGMVDDLTLTHNYSTKRLVKKIIKYIDFLEQNKEFHTDFYECGDRISVSYRI